MRKILITCGRVTFKADLFDTATVQMMVNEMPLTGNVNFWGDEIYFPVPFTAELEEDAQEEVEVGTIAYWPPSKAFCIFFGPTPVSTSSKPKGYSAVNICGKIHGDMAILRSIIPGEQIKVDLEIEI